VDFLAILGNAVASTAPSSTPSPFQGLNVANVTQMVFSVGVCWYLLIVFSKKLDDLTQLVRDTQKDHVSNSEDTKQMFSEIKELIKETSKLVNVSAESNRIQNELTKATLARLERQEGRERL
jgi:hypothetical protein